MIIKSKDLSLTRCRHKALINSLCNAAERICKNQFLVRGCPQKIDRYVFSVKFGFIVERNHQQLIIRVKLRLTHLGKDHCLDFLNRLERVECVENNILTRVGR